MNSKGNVTRQDVSLCFCAAAEEKLRSMEELVGRLLSKAGFYVFIEKRYGAGTQGGNSLQVRVSSTPVKVPVDRIDYLFLLPGGLPLDIVSRIASKTKIVGDVGTVTRCSPKLREREAVIVELPLAVRIKELNCGAHEAEALAGVTAALFGLNADSANALLERREDPEISSLKAAFRLGHALGVEIDEGVLVARYLRSNKKEVLMDAGTAISLGAAAGGCNFVASHPSSFSSSSSGAIFNFYADNSERFGAVALRAEDKPGALNMCIGAAYAGARALLTTSGRCSVSEAIEAANLSETPLVIHAAPRHDAKAASGSEQAPSATFCFGYEGFPHVVYAPVSVESAFSLGARAFATAEKFRTPVVLMTDPYLLEVAYDVEPSLPDEKEKNALKGLPGLVSKTYTDKRMEKRAVLLDNALPPKLFGDPVYQTLIVSWGFLQETLLEALRAAETERRFDTRGVAVLSCEQVYPLHSQTGIFLKQAHRLIFVEHNATGQFARFVHTETGCVPTDIVLKYGKEPFSVKELTERLQNLLAPEEAVSPKTEQKDPEKKEPDSLALPVVEFPVVPAVPGEKNGGETA